MVHEFVKNWPEAVGWIAAKYNAGWCATINESPYYVVFGRDYSMMTDPKGVVIKDNHNKEEPRLTMDEITRKAIDYREKAYAKLSLDEDDIKRLRKTFVAGDIVWWDSRGFEASINKLCTAKGPFRVVRVLADNTYELKRIGDLIRTTSRASGDHLIICHGEGLEV
jgi:hypothetical protein